MSSRMELLRARVLEEAKKKADSLLKESRITASNLKHDATEIMNLTEINLMNKIKASLEEEFLDNKGVLEKEKVRKLLQFKQDTLDDVINTAISKFKKKLNDNPDFYYKTYLPGSIEAGIQNTVLKEYFLSVNKKDHKYIQDHLEYLKKFKKKIILTDEPFPDDDLGCIIHDKQSNVMFDNRLSKKIEMKIQYLKTRISQVLFKGA